MTNDTMKIQIRMDDAVKTAWENASKALGYATLSEFIRGVVNDFISQENPSIDPVQMEIIKSENNSQKQKLIRQLQKNHRSQAFFAHRQIQMLWRYHSSKNVSVSDITDEIRLSIQMAKTTKDPKKALTAILATCLKYRWKSQANEVKAEMVKLGMTQKEITRLNGYTEDAINAKR